MKTLHSRRADTLVRAAVVSLLLAPSLAMATGSGSGIPETGGPGAGASSADTRGLYYNPAAAVGAGGTELDLDLGLNVLSIHYQRAGNDPRNGNPFPGADSFNLAQVPYFAVRSDSISSHGADRLAGHGEETKLGFGFSLAAPFGRSVHYHQDSPARYHVVSLDYFTTYLTPSVAYRPTHSVRIGAGPIIAYSQYGLRQRVDLAPILQAQQPSTPPPPAESDLLNGELFVRQASGVGIGGAFGLLVDASDSVTLGLGFLSGSVSTAKGRARVTPSQDFNVYANSDFSITRRLPPIINAGARIRPAEAPVEISLEVQYVGWHVADRDEIVLSHSQLGSDSTEVSALITALGVNQSTLVSGLLDKKQYYARGWDDSFNGILGVEYKYKPFRSRFEIGYDKSAIPDENVTPGNLDFDSLVLGASARYEPADRGYSAQIAVSQYLSNGRTVRSSAWDTFADPATGFGYPSGTGTYSAVLTRLALTFGYRF